MILKEKTEYDNIDVQRHIDATYPIVKKIYFDLMLRSKALEGSAYADKLVDADFEF